MSRLRASEIARQVRAGERSAVEVVQDALCRVAARDGELNACAQRFDEAALGDAGAVDKMLASGRDPGPLAGVPFFVKSNLDVAGHITVAGSPTRLTGAPAIDDAAVVARMRAAGAVPIGTAHMDEYACGATGENPHFGPVRLPRDPSRMTGGSSSGSAASVAAGYVPLSLGTDTNGSIRAPAALCGVWGIRPTQDRVSVSGCVPYAATLDAVGGFASDLNDLAALYEVIAQTRLPVWPSSHGLRVGVLGGDFAMHADAQQQQAVRLAAAGFSDVGTVALDSAVVAEVRNAAVVVSNYEVSRAHAHLLHAPIDLVSAKLRDRIETGLAISDVTYRHALDRRTEWCALMHSFLVDFDVLIAAATPFAAPRFDSPVVEVNGHSLVVARTLGMLTQPISFAGLPVVTMPIATSYPLPCGVQLIAAANAEATCFAAAAQINAGS